MQEEGKTVSVLLVNDRPVGLIAVRDEPREDALDGLRAARGAVASSGARTTVVAHSYGTWVVDEAADEPGRLAADAVVLLGSPGMDGAAADLETPSVFDATTPADPISMMLMAIPLYLLYELGLFTLRVMPAERVLRGTKEPADAGDA